METTQPERQAMSSERLARIDTFLRQNYIDNRKLPNAQLVVARNGQPVHYTSLGTLRADGTTLRDDALFRIASMTKPVTSIAFMQLVERGEVALDHPVTRVIPEFAGLSIYNGGSSEIGFVPGPAAPPMRMVDLLTHMSGLTYGLQNRTNIDAGYRAENLDIVRTHHDSDSYIATLARFPLEFAPGGRWNYSVSTDVLGVVVERLTGMRLGDYFQEHIFAPLGMIDTAFGVAHGQGDRLADAYGHRAGKPPELIDKGAASELLEPGSFDSGGAGLVGTLSDYHRFAQMLLGGGALDGARIVSPKTLALMTANHLPGGADLTALSDSLFSESQNAGVGFGLGFACVIDPARTLRPATKGEFYWGGAYSTAFFVDPVERVELGHHGVHDPALPFVRLPDP
jgi:CubicO group peptidase (beta-lactamase class C family)